MGLPTLIRLAFQGTLLKPNTLPVYLTNLCLPLVLYMVLNILNYRSILFKILMDLFSEDQVFRQKIFGFFNNLNHSLHFSSVKFWNLFLLIYLNLYFRI